jgi:Flp pilus assembly protein protease CpaA
LLGKGTEYFDRGSLIINFAMPMPPNHTDVSSLADAIPERCGRRFNWRWVVPLFIPFFLIWPWLLVSHKFSLPQTLEPLTGLILVLLLTASTIVDLRWQHIWNWITYPAIVWGIILHILTAVWGNKFTVAGSELDATLVGTTTFSAFSGLILGFVSLLILYLVFGGGAGDAKLMAGVGVLSGLEMVLSTLAYGFIMAGIVASIYVLWKTGRLAMSGGKHPELHQSVQAPTRSFPMAPFFACGMMLSIFWRVL